MEKTVIKQAIVKVDSIVGARSSRPLIDRLGHHEDFAYIFIIITELDSVIQKFSSSMIAHWIPALNAGMTTE